MDAYRLLFPLIRLLPSEFAHRLALAALRLPVRVAAPPSDAYTWQGLTFRNRVGVAAGFDKNAECIPGIERLGAGFVEVGTVLVSPWAGNQVSPRMSRLVPQRALWNRLGFTSLGVERVKHNLAATPRAARRGMVIACNIGPHPGNLKQAPDRAAALLVAREEMMHLAGELHAAADLFVVNLSSPNTQGLRSLLQSPDISEAVLRPLRDRIRELDRQSNRKVPTPVLVKLPPEVQERNPWTEDMLRAVLLPMLAADVCDGFVATNTSVRLTFEHMPHADLNLPGGISGGPLRPEALRLVAMVRSIIGDQKLLIGCGGIVEPEHAVEFIQAGADLVEIYSGMVYSGPGLIARCAVTAAKRQ
jgi:dihydroorotate dehydrogenase